jgi:hypothetical protein
MNYIPISEKSPDPTAEMKQPAMEIRVLKSKSTNKQGCRHPARQPAY